MHAAAPKDEEAVVIGAGPAGACVALQLVRRGVSTTIVERARMPRTKVCGEYLAPAALDAFHQLGVLPVIERRGHRLRSLALAGYGIGPIRMRLPGRGGLALARCDLDMLLRDEAVSAGAKFVQGTFVNVEDDLQCARVAYRDEAGAEKVVRARVVVGADGAWSTVAQRAGLADKTRRGGRWAVGGHLATAECADDVQMYVGPRGYYARNPLGSGFTNAMLVMPRPMLDDEAETMVRTISGGVCGFDAAGLVRRVAVGPLRYRARAYVTGRIVLTGDAAELLDPFLGQGIALAAGLADAAVGAAQRLLSGERASSVARCYRHERAAAVQSVRFAARAIDAMLRTPWLRARAARALERRPQLADELLGAIIESARGRSLSPRLLWGLLV